tara:strand:- start:16 stop:1017 length:1002 start_codon:yes stop_codon:yes gene_type:complete
MKKKIFVSGGGGFIGSHLVEKLIELGHKVKTIVPYNIDNSWGWIDHLPKKTKDNLEVISGDICDQNLILRETKKIEIFFHLAALISIPYSYKSPQSYVSTNINGTVNILEAAKNSNAELFVQTSTSEVYGSAQTIPITENHPLNAQSPYAASKIAGDQLAMSYHKSFGLPSLVLRPFNTYGPRQSLRAFIPSTIKQILESDKKIQLGNLNSKRDFTYVSDTVDGYISAIGNKKCIGETIQLGTGIDFSMRETFENIKKIIGKNVKVVKDKNRMRPKMSEVNRLISSNKKAKKILKWKPKYSGKNGFIKGLKETVEWFDDSKNLSQYKSKLYNY